MRFMKGDVVHTSVKENGLCKTGIIIDANTLKRQYLVQLDKGQNAVWLSEKEVW